VSRLDRTLDLLCPARHRATAAASVPRGPEGAKTRRFAGRVSLRFPAKARGAGCGYRALQVVSGQARSRSGTIRDGAAVPSPRRFDLNGRWQELRAHLTVPLYRNAYALMLNTGVTGLLGLLYWLLAARHYTPVEVGRAVSALTPQ